MTRAQPGFARRSSRVLRKSSRRDRLEACLVICSRNARSRDEASDDVEPAVAGAAGAEKSSAAPSEAAGRCGAARAIAGLRRDVRGEGPALGAAGTTAEGESADGVLHGPQ